MLAVQCALFSLLFFLIAELSRNPIVKCFRCVVVKKENTFCATGHQTQANCKEQNSRKPPHGAIVRKNEKLDAQKKTPKGASNCF